MGYDSSRVKVIGPFDIAWDTAGIGAAHIQVPGSEALPAGTDVLKIWAEVTTAWNSVTSDSLSVGVSNAAIDSTVVGYTADVNAASGATATAYIAPVATVDKPITSRVDTALLTCQVTSAGGSLSAGAARIYALIQTADTDE